MQKEQCFYLGKIAKKFSFKGEVLIYLDTDEPYLYENLESVFVELHKNLVPFFILKSGIHKNNFLRVRFEDVESEEDADAIMNCEVYLPMSFLPKLEGDKFYYHEITDFLVEDIRLGKIGNIKRVNDSNHQPLLEIMNGEVEILVPLIDDFIIEVDRKNKIFKMDIPEGLVEMYL
ncbi:ribosome maturation factor RimM [uncultured Flavobacterium sp.]|uniref:ribosome maturation factor RimM n=1 Tax=uncultured Flavobacterium sp. TaxID=165435 RepID=UPI0030EDA9BC|tara:strand:- start:202466 stop:202990 length:525 start_codon:yes stop_codon:yes gene_type:complete